MIKLGKSMHPLYFILDWTCTNNHIHTDRWLRAKLLNFLYVWIIS